MVGSFRSGEFTERTGRPAVELASTGFAGGIDFRLGPSSLIGLIGGIDSTDAQLSPGSGDSGIESWFAGAYGSFAVGPAFVDLVASYTDSDYELVRGIAVGPFVAQSAAETASQQWMLGGTVGFRLQASSLDIEPYAGLRYIDLDLDGFVETGNIAGLTIGDADIESLQSIVGVSAEVALPIGGVDVRPSLRAEWRHEFSNDESRLIAGSFGGVGAFNFATVPLSDDHFVLGAGLSVGGGPVTMVLDYNGQLSGGYDIHAFTGGVRIRF
ncbi:MAG: autotransporter outer membrane beta-barrel domain-containing protein [Sphingosinicella sp.]